MRIAFLVFVISRIKFCNKIVFWDFEQNFGELGKLEIRISIWKWGLESWEGLRGRSNRRQTGLRQRSESRLQRTEKQILCKSCESRLISHSVHIRLSFDCFRVLFKSSFKLLFKYLANFGPKGYSNRSKIRRKMSIKYSKSQTWHKLWLSRHCCRSFGRIAVTKNR